MGFFDSYYDAGSYAQGGGLIDRLMAQLGTQSQYQPAPGFPQSPMEAQAALPQSAPIAVGDYQMPRIGGADLYQPQQAMTPPNAMPTQGQMPQPASSFLQPQNSPGGFSGVMRGALANMQGGPLGVIGGAIAGGMGMGQGTDQDQAYRMLNQKYQALVPILGEQKARLAVLSPEAETKLLGDALGKNFNFTTLPDGTIVRQDPRTGEVQPVYSGGAKPTFGVINEEDGRKVYGWIDPNKRTVSPYAAPGASGDRGTVDGPDGKPIPIPPGVDRATFVKEISRANAKAAAGEKTEVQAKSEKFANKMELAEKNLGGLDGQYTDTIGAGGFFRGTEYVPGGNALQSSSYQKYKQARDNFITALLRDESGAAIGTAEFNRYERELFPQPGDGPEVVAQKREARRVAIEGMKKSAGPGYKSPTIAGDAGGKSDPLGIR